MTNTTQTRQSISLNRNGQDALAARDVMSTSLLAAQDSWSVAELAQFLVSNGITGAPVLDEDEHLVGVVSVTDVARFASRGDDLREERGRHGYYTDSLDSWSSLDYLEDSGDNDLEITTVKDIMTPSIFAVDTHASVNEVAREMVSNGIHRVFVRQQERIVGVVSALDILKLATP
ncbi:CBS domain-containing protein [Ketobacter sp.]|uniref:CBS domain-containing protein n=1 Tax=Ketobacter sp. TaxID=2083498 RepID=UPI0025BBDABE|nr:CBS domain-containing protein [Ketobacter sp.]